DLDARRVADRAEPGDSRATEQRGLIQRHLLRQFHHRPLVDEQHFGESAQADKGLDGGSLPGQPGRLTGWARAPLVVAVLESAPLTPPTVPAERGRAGRHMI